MRVDEDTADASYIEQQEALEKGQKVVLALSLRGINHHREKKTVGPNIKADTIFAMEKQQGQRAPDLSTIVEE